VIRAERKRYDSREENAQLFEQLSPMRTVLSPSSQETLRSLPSGIQRTLETAEPSKLQSDDMGDLGPELAKAQSKRAKVAETHPILRDPELRTSALLADDADELGEVLRENADDRLSDIHKTRANVLDKRDFVFKLDRVKALAQGELGVTAGTVYESIINDHEKSLKFAQLIIGIATGALAIGLGVVSFGTGTVAVVAGAGSLALSIAGAAEAVETYSAESAAAHTSFDEALTLSSDDPSAVWVVLALIGVGFDGAALVNAAKSVLPAAKLLATASDIGKFESELAKLTSLSDAVKESLVRAGRAEAEYRTAVQDMTTAMLRESNRLYTTPFPVDVLTKMVKAAYYAAKKNITDFEVFLRDLRAQKFARDIDFDQLSAAQMRQLEAAFRTGTEQVAAEAKPFSMTLKYSKGDKTLTVDDGGRLLLDGKPISATKLNTEVIPKLRIEHALEGHGPDRNVSDVMKEALTNGPSYASGKFNSMQTMLESLQKARAEFEATFDAANTTRRVTKEIDVTPEVGRVFVRSDKVPSGIDKTVPFNAPEGVSELVATKVRAVFEPNGDLVTIYPIGL
jgi:hypothetical protein